MKRALTLSLALALTACGGPSALGSARDLLISIHSDDPVVDFDLEEVERAPDHWVLKLIYRYPFRKNDQSLSFGDCALAHVMANAGKRYYSPSFDDSGRKPGALERIGKDMIFVRVRFPDADEVADIQGTAKRASDEAWVAEDGRKLIDSGKFLARYCRDPKWVALLGSA